MISTGNTKRVAGYLLCPVCENYTWIPEGAKASKEPQICELHFPTYSRSDYALPAKSLDDVVEDEHGNVTFRVCPGSGQPGTIVA